LNPAGARASIAAWVIVVVAVEYKSVKKVMKLATLDDVRRLVDKHLPAEYRSKFAWRKLAALLRSAAQGKDDAAEVFNRSANHSQSRAGAVPGLRNKAGGPPNATRQPALTFEGCGTD
jgi:hypothetical protein